MPVKFHPLTFIPKYRNGHKFINLSTFNHFCSNMLFNKLPSIFTPITTAPHAVSSHLRKHIVLKKQ